MSSHLLSVCILPLAWKHKCKNLGEKEYQNVCSVILEIEIWHLFFKIKFIILMPWLRLRVCALYIVQARASDPSAGQASFTHREVG